MSDPGEFGLIERLRAALPPTGRAMLLGPGDDAAVWRQGDGYVLATTDTMVAGVHFLPGVVRWEDVGWKALAVNISDIAAMGGTPTYALVTLALPPESLVADVDALYAGLRECAEAYGVTIAGGDIVSAPVWAITIALFGEAALSAGGEPLLLRRDSARAGDAIAVTGPLGGSAGGLRVLQDGLGNAAASTLVRRHMRPQPRIDAGHASVTAGVRCGIDISDGLVRDLGHICDASGVGAEVELERVPIDAALIDAYPGDAAMMAATGGEDYELVLIGDEAAIERASRALGGSLTVIGRVVEGARVRVLDAHGGDVTFGATGWDHLASKDSR